MPPPDLIELRGLRVDAIVGVLPHERTTPQPLAIDLDIEADLARAGATDDLGDTVDYGDVAKGLLAVIEGEPVNLIETLAQRLADVCLADERVQRVELTVHKPDAPIPATFGDVTVSIARDRG